MPIRTSVLALAALSALAPALVTSQVASSAQKKAIERVSASSLQGHVSFLASDALEGRGTPSRGLNLAAEYIASQFRRAGLKPGVGEGYFQTTKIRASRTSTEEETVQNVIGVLPGTDPVLKDTYVLVTAHYDHLGVRGEGEDKIFNGANDDASGTAMVMEVADALKGYKPKRTIVFMTFYGEERGLVGSTFYGRNPVFPIQKTVAMINLEQVGRTDDSEGPRVAAVSVTGYDYTDVGPILQAAGKQTSIGVQKHPQFSDMFFARSDNAALALQGVPAHTICTAFEYPDYHQAGDHWDKLGYANMEKVGRMITLAVAFMADSPTEPKWNAGNPKTARFITAWKALREKG